MQLSPQIYLGVLPHFSGLMKHYEVSSFPSWLPGGYFGFLMGGGDHGLFGHH